MSHRLFKIIKLSQTSSYTLRFASNLAKLNQRPVMGLLDEELQRPKIAVRNKPADDFLDLTMRFGGNTSSTMGMRSRLFNFHRLKEENLGRTLERMSQNLTTKVVIKRKKFKKSSSPQPEQDPPVDPIASSVQMALKMEDVLISPEIPNIFAWRDGAELLVDQCPYAVVVNPPSIVAGKITTYILPDFPLDFSLDFEFAREEDAIFVWLKQVVGTRSPADQVSEDIRQASLDLPLSLSAIQEIVAERMKPIGTWRIASLDRDWRPTKDDIGAFVGLLCIPTRDGIVGDPFTTAAKNVVTDGIPAAIPETNLRRLELCQTRCGPDSFRAVSYNLLADTYGAMESSLRDLFPYCPPQFMNIDYRRQLAMKEMLGYNADVLCLQEVDTKHFENSFLMPFRRKGYNGVVQRKRGTVAEGVATFYRTDKFALLKQHDINITESLFEDPFFSDIAAAINDKAKLKETMMDRGTPVQVSVLQSRENPSRILIVANTHLWFRPQFPHVRLLQMAVITGHLENVVKATKTERNLDRDPAVMICGDFNSTAPRGVHEFLRTGTIPSSFPEWKEFCKEEDESVELNLKHPFQLYSACGQLPHTNFVPNFKAAIDWIYADASALETVSVIPVPTEEELSAHVAIPSVVFPSDHIAVGCDLRWKS